MRNEYRNKYILILSLPLALLLIVVSYIGFVEADTYSKESLNWTLQTTSQDAIDLFLISPFLLITSLFVFRKSEIALFLWSGGVLYVFYTFVIYCFDIHFNKLFLVYCLILGLSFYSLTYLWYTQSKMLDNERLSEHMPRKSLGFYFIIVACSFILLWLLDILPAIIHNSVPYSLREIGTFTNPVQVIDLSILLPGFIITAGLLLKKRPLGIFLAPVLLTFCLLMDSTIAVLAVIMNIKGQGENWVIPLMMGILAIITMFLLVMCFKNMYPHSHVENRIKYFYPLRS